MASKQDVKNKQKRMARMTDARKRAEEHESGFRPTAFNPGKLPVFDWGKKGVFVLDIVPYEAGKGNPYSKPGFGHYERTFYVHKNVGSEGGFGNNYCCLKRTFGEACPICDYRAALEADAGADKDKLALIDKLKSKERQLMLVLVRDGGKEEAKGIQVYEGPNFNGLGKALDDKISLSSESDGYNLFYDPDDGKRLRVEVSEETYNGKPWFKPFGIEFKDREPLEDKWLKVATPGILDNMLVRMSYKELQEIFLQGESGRGANKQSGTAETNGKHAEPAADANDNVDTGTDVTIEVGSRVQFSYRGAEHIGDVVAINNAKGLAKVQCDDRPDPYTVALNELAPAVEEPPAADDWDTSTTGTEGGMVEGSCVTVPKKPDWGDCVIVQFNPDGSLRLEDDGGKIHDKVPADQVVYEAPAATEEPPADDWGSGDDATPAADADDWGSGDDATPAATDTPADDDWGTDAATPAADDDWGTAGGGWGDEDEPAPAPPPRKVGGKTAAPPKSAPAKAAAPAAKKPAPKKGGKK